MVERLATLTVRYASFDSLMISGVVDMLKPSHFRYIPRAHFLKAPYTLVTCIAGLLQQFGPALNIDELGRLFQEHTGVEWGLVNRITLKLFITSNSRYFAYGMDDLVRLKPNTVGRIAATAASKALAPSNRMQIDCDRQQPDIAEALDISDDVDIAVLPGPPPSAVNAKRAGVPREKQKLKRPRMTPAASSVGSSNMDVANPDVSPAAVGAAMAVNPETPAPADVLRADPMQLDVPVPINLDDEDDF